jgi:hypothetical protein
MNDQPEDGASNGLSFMISLGRRLSMSPAEAWKKSHPDDARGITFPYFLKTTNPLNSATSLIQRTALTPL